MSGFWKGVVAGLALMSIGWLGLIYFQLGRPVLSSQWVHDDYRKKEAIASRTPSPKIVIVAGSGALFGIDSKRLQRAFGRPVVNMGVNAGLQLPYILYEARKVIKPGDTVLLPLEYPDLYTYDGRPNFQIISYMYAFDPKFFWELSWRERWRMLWETPLSRIVEGYLKTGGKPVDFGIYGAHRIDEMGDQTHTARQDMTPQILAERKACVPKKIHPKDLSDGLLSWRYLERFSRWATLHRVKIFLIPAAMMDDPSYHRGLAWQFFHTLPTRAREHGLKFIGNPTDFFYPREYFFNTIYHLNAEGRERHTKRLIELLTSHHLFQ